MTNETRKRPWRKYVRRSLLGLGVVTMLWLFSSFATAYYFTRRIGGPTAKEPAPQFGSRNVEPHRLMTADGEELGAWFVEGKPNKPIVLLLHGYRDRRGAMTKHARFFADEGCPVLMLTFRAHGDSSGNLNDVGFSAKHDVIAGVKWLREKCPDRPLIVYGRSMGAAAAMFAAKDLGNQVAGYIWEVPYRDLYSALQNRTELYLPPVLSWIGYAGLRLTAPVVLPYAGDIAPVRYVDDIPESIPILLLSGKKDRRTKPEETRDIYQRVQSHATHVVFEKAGHVDIRQSNPEKYAKVVRDFLGTIAREK
ncbi:MAG: alpha/beta hydrolase [Gemmataceae bacterium]